MMEMDKLAPWAGEKENGWRLRQTTVREENVNGRRRTTTARTAMYLTREELAEILSMAHRELDEWARS